MANYRPQIFIRTADITVSLSFPEGTPSADEKMVTFITRYCKQPDHGIAGYAW